MRDGAGDAVGDELQRGLGHALEVKAARQRARRQRRVGEIDRGCGDALAEPAAERALALGMGEAVERQGAEELKQHTDRFGFEHDPIVARAKRGRLRACDLRRRARGKRGRVDTGRGDGRRRRVTAATVRVAADDLHEAIADLLLQPRAAAGRDRGPHGADGPGAEGLQAVLGGDGERRAQSVAGARRIQARRGLVEAVVAGRGGRLGKPRVRAGAAMRGGPCGRLGAADGGAQRVVVEAVRRGERGVAVVDDEDLHRRVLDGGRLRRRGPRKARHERALADDRHLHLPRSRERERALGGLQGRLARRVRRAHATPTCTSRKRAGAVPCETRMTCPGSPLPQLPRPHSRHSEREQTASRPFQKRGVTPA